MSIGNKPFNLLSEEDRKEVENIQDIFNAICIDQFYEDTETFYNQVIQEGVTKYD